MAKQSDFKPQMEQKHPERWLAGQNIGPRSREAERTTHTAYDVKSVHRALQNFTDDELKQIPILDEGTHLRIRATYLDLDQGEFTPATDMLVNRGQKVVPKDAVHYETWNKLIGEEKP